MRQGRRTHWLDAGLGPLLMALLLLGSCSAPPAERAAAPAPPPAAPTQSPAPPALVPIRYATQRPVSDAGIFIAHARGYFREEGLDVDLVDVASANDMIPLLATGEIDTGGTAPIAAFFNAVARGVIIKTVAERGSNAPGHGYSAVVVRKDLIDSGRFQDFADLRGKQIGVSPPVGGGGVSAELLVALDRGGVAWEEVEVKALSLQELDLALQGGSLDVIMGVEPWVSRAVQGGYGVRWKGVDEIYPNHMLGGLAYSPVFAAQRPDAARAFMVAYVRAVRDYNDALRKGRDKDAIYSILTEYSTVKDRAVIERMVLPGISPEPFVNRESVARDLELFIRLGTVRERVDINQLIDDQYVQFAVDKLGRYQ
ncbi:MAG TPA: ABC transporter substrate-binding protein [Chloroflexota bacterium]|nr:ABC transporter substrate-binding protein [Chloroflexota bacterium]